MPNDKNKSQFSLEPVEGNTNLFTINPTNPQQVLIKNTTLNFSGSGNKHKLNDPDLQYFITNTQFDREIQNVGIIYTFLNDMKHNLSYSDEKSSRYNMIKCLFQPQLGSGLNQYTRVTSPSKSLTCIPSDPGELVDQPKLIVLEKVAGTDNPMLGEQIVAITDKLLEYECIRTNQHQKITSSFS